MRILGILVYLRSEVERPDRFQAQATRLAYVVHLETACCVANALDLDYRYSQIVWLVSDEVLALLWEFVMTPKITIPAEGDQPACLRGISDVESACRSACSLGEEYLFERLHIPSGKWVRWAFLTPEGFVKANEFKGPLRRGRAVIAPRRRSSHPGSDSGQAYFGGFTPRVEATHAIPSGRVSTERSSGLSSLVADEEIRRAPGLESLLRDYPVRDGGWSIRELLVAGVARIDREERGARSSDDCVRELEGRLVAANRFVDAWREHIGRVARPYTPVGPSWMSDPYANPEAKRSLYAYGDREPDSYPPPPAPCTPPQGGAGPSAAAPSLVPRDSYASDPYAPASRYYRS